MGSTNPKLGAVKGGMGQHIADLSNDEVIVFGKVYLIILFIPTSRH